MMKVSAFAFLVALTCSLGADARPFAVLRSGRALIVTWSNKAIKHEAVGDELWDFLGLRSSHLFANLRFENPKYSEGDTMSVTYPDFYMVDLCDEEAPDHLQEYLNDNFSESVVQGKV